MIALGRGATMLVRWLINWPTLASLSAIVAAVAVSAIVGIAAASYHADLTPRMPFAGRLPTLLRKLCALLTLRASVGSTDGWTDQLSEFSTIHFLIP